MARELLNRDGSPMREHNSPIIEQLLKEMEMSNNWKLDKIEIQFKPGYSFDNSIDRYEGKIKFSNGDGESFLFNIDQVKCNEYIQIIAPEIVKTAEILSGKLISSLGLDKTGGNNEQ
jgi:hypothetical protein